MQRRACPPVHQGRMTGTRKICGAFCYTISWRGSDFFPTGYSYPQNLRAARVRRRNSENGTQEVAHPMTFSPTRVIGRREGPHLHIPTAAIGPTPSTKTHARHAAQTTPPTP